MRVAGAHVHTKKEMAESADLKHMVMTFRVSELQVLLGFAGRNKTGRKQELLTRALNLVQKGCSMPVQIKIRELYRLIKKVDDLLESQTASIMRRFPAGGVPAGPPDITGPPQSPQNTPHHPPESRGLDYGKHVPMMPPSRPPNSVPVHPDVRLKVLPFYDLQGELLKPSSLVPRGAVRFQENYFVFHLTPQQAQDIAMSRDYRPCAKSDYLVQVQLRFCLLETSCEQDDNFPPSICVRVNGKMAALPNPIPSAKPGVEPRRPSRPVDITPLCRLSPTSSNHVDVSWASEFGRGYCVAIYLVKKLSSDILFTRLKQKGTKHPDHSRALIKEKLSHDPDSEIATTSLRVSLCCPLGKMRMLNPSRASTCSHLQCFDASTFLMMNEKKPTWTCPVCDKPAPFHKLIIDGLFVEILQQAFDCKEIQFMEDCSWKPLRANKESHLIASPIIDNSSSSQSSSKKKPVPEIIDLTSETSDDDDDDDDDDPIEASPPPKLTQAGCVSPPITPTLECTPPILTHYTNSLFNTSSSQQPLIHPSSMFFSQPLTPSPKLSTSVTPSSSPYSLPKGMKIKCRLDSPPPAHSSPVKTLSHSPVSFKPSYRMSPYPTVSSPNLYSHLGIPGLTPLSQQYYQDMYKMFQLNQATTASQYYNQQSYVNSPLNLSMRSVMERDSDDPMAS